MAEGKLIKTITTTGGQSQIDYQSLANLPTALKNPNKLTFTGAVTAEYDGDQAVTVNIPQNQSSIKTITITQDQIISQEPIQIQFTTAQRSVIEDSETNIQMLIDASAIGLGKMICDTSEGSDEILIFCSTPIWSWSSHREGIQTYHINYNTSTGIGTFGIGKILPSVKTSDMTQEVGADSEGKLWTVPGGQSSCPIISSDGTQSFIGNDNQNNKASGENSSATGSKTHAYGATSTAQGTSSTTFGSNFPEYATSMPSDSEILSTWQGLGDNKFSIAKGVASNVEGTNCLALGKNSHAEGNGTVASNSAAHSEGTGTVASGKYSHAGGLETAASDNYALAHGYKVKSTGKSSVAFGSNDDDTITSNASGQNSFSDGKNVQANHYCSQAFGEGTKTYKDYQFVTGRFNATTDNDDRFVIGNGTSNENRSNATVIDSNGNTWVYGNLYVGEDAQEVILKESTLQEGDSIQLVLKDEDNIVGYVLVAPHYTLLGSTMQIATGTGIIGNMEEGNLIGNVASSSPISELETIGVGPFAGDLDLNNQTITPFEATKPHHITTKKYVDDKVTAVLPTLPTDDKQYILSVTNGVLSWIEKT